MPNRDPSYQDYRHISPYGDRRLDDRSGARPGSPGGYAPPDMSYGDAGYMDPWAVDRPVDRRRYAREERSFQPSRDYPSEFDDIDYGQPERGPGAYRRWPEYEARGGHRRDGPSAREREMEARQRALNARIDAYNEFFPGATMNPYAGWPGGVGPDYHGGHGRSGLSEDQRREVYRGGGDRDFWDRAGDEVASWFGDEGARARREMDRGEHAGRGPKGYKRSDNRINEDVCDRLSHDSWLDASQIEVRVRDGEVTLDGKVARREDKKRAESWAEAVAGVDHVQNNLRVDRDLFEETTPASTARGGETAVSPVGENATIAKQMRGGRV